LRRRLLTAAVAIPAVVLLVSYAPQWLFALVIAALSLIAAREFTALAAAQGIRVYPVLLAILAPLLAVGSPTPVSVIGSTLGSESMIVMEEATLWRVSLLPLALIALAVLAVIVRVLFGSRPLAELLPSAATTLFGALWFGYLASYLVAVRLLGTGPLYTLLLGVWVGDSGALFVGKLLGGRKLAPRLSPGKTLAGLGGEFLGAYAGVLGGARIFHLPLSPLQVVLMPLLIALAAVAGDLAESALKRGAGVKDTGALFPGHGGVLDRLDSLLFAAPVMYYCLVLSSVPSNP
jgi:phosphatidate cytidylyltransferase